MKHSGRRGQLAGQAARIRRSICNCRGSAGPSRTDCKHTGRRQRRGQLAALCGCARRFTCDHRRCAGPSHTHCELGKWRQRRQQLGCKLRSVNGCKAESALIEMTLNSRYLLVIARSIREDFHELSTPHTPPPPPPITTTNTNTDTTTTHTQHNTTPPATTESHFHHSGSPARRDADAPGPRRSAHRLSSCKRCRADSLCPCDRIWCISSKNTPDVR